jgi:hypothetical protein
VQFDRDSIDETPELAQTLGDGAACTPFLDMQVRTLTGDHARPLQQVRSWSDTRTLLGLRSHYVVCSMIGTIKVTSAHRDVMAL